MTKDEIWLRTIAQKNSTPITDIQLEKLGRYAGCLKGWNQKINLVSRKDEENIWTNHLLLSVAILFKLEFAAGSKILDLGTGGGLPGIPLGIMRPDIQFVLLDSIQKKTNAVSDMAKQLGLANVIVVCSRAEVLSDSPAYANAFDAVIARGVSGLENVVLWAAPFLKPKNPAADPRIPEGVKLALAQPSVIALKGGETETEVAKTKRRFPHARIRSMELAFNGGEVLANAGKRLIIVEPD